MPLRYALAVANAHAVAAARARFTREQQMAAGRVRIAWADYRDPCHQHAIQVARGGVRAIGQSC